MKKIYPSRKILFLEIMLPLFLAWSITFIALMVLQQYIAAIVVSCVMLVLFIISCILPIKSWLAEICFNENSINYLVGHKVKKSISWNELRVINFVKAKRRSIILRTSIDSREYIGMPCNSKNIEVLSEYIHKAVNAELIGMENLSSKEQAKLRQIN